MIVSHMDNRRVLRFGMISFTAMIRDDGQNEGKEQSQSSDDVQIDSGDGIGCSFGSKVDGLHVVIGCR